MRSSGLLPDRFSLSSLLLACSELSYLPSGIEIHGFVLRNGLEFDPFVNVSLISFNFQCDKPHFAWALFDGTVNKNQVFWNAMISGYVQMNIFRHMLEQGIRPNEIAITCLLGACSQLSCLRIGKDIHCFTLKSNLTKDKFVNCSILDMYAKCASWTAMISGYAVHGHGNEALLLIKQMQKEGLRA
ncbi:hypothetical protein RDABS01_033181 [Bienertia sinuspersici]